MFVFVILKRSVMEGSYSPHYDGVTTSRFFTTVQDNIK